MLGKSIVYVISYRDNRDAFVQVDTSTTYGSGGYPSPVPLEYATKFLAEHLANAYAATMQGKGFVEPMELRLVNRERELGDEHLADQVVRKPRC